jgi:hypothetical protein
MRKKEKKQENILLATWGLFRQKGIDKHFALHAGYVKFYWIGYSME